MANMRQLRRSDFTLSDDQEALRDSFRSFFARECPTSRVRAAEPLGFDRDLWTRLVELGVEEMGSPSASDDGASLVDLALVTEELGRVLAPLPLVEVLVALRALDGSDAPTGAIEHEFPTFAPRVATPGVAQLIPNGAVATAVVALAGDSWRLESLPAGQASPANLGSVPVGWWCASADPVESTVVLGLGADAFAAHRRARAEWHVLTGAALVGAGDVALELAVAYAKERIAFDVPIGTFQAVAHPLVDVATAVIGARRLVWKAAWFLDHEPDVVAALPAMAFVYASRAASLAARTGIHTQGGLGFTTESDLQLYFRRTKAWSLMAGDLQRTLLDGADERYGSVDRSTEA